MSEDDDEDGFGDFTFASFNNPSFNSHQQTQQINGPKSPVTAAVIKDDGDGDGDDDDDEWGDFVETPLGSFASSNNTPSKSSNDPFDFFSPNQNPISQLQQSESGNSKLAEFGLRGEEEKKNQNQNHNQWVKPKGAIPLSIFGDVEEEEKEEDVGRSGGSVTHGMNGKDFRNGRTIDNVSNGLMSNGYAGVSFSGDSISILYNPQMSTKDNGVGLNMYGMSLNNNGVDLSKKDSILELSGLNLNAVSVHKRSDSDGVMNLSNQSQKRKVEDGINVSSNGMSSNLDALNLDFSGLNTDFNGFISKPGLDFEVTKNLNDRSQQNIDEISNSLFNSNGIDFGMKDRKNSHFDGFNSNSDVMLSNLLSSSSNANGVDMHLEFNDRNGGHTEDDDDNDDDDGWEFKDANAQAKVGEGSEKARCEVEKTLENNAAFELGNGNDRSTNLFNASNGLSDMFFILKARCEVEKTLENNAAFVLGNGNDRSTNLFNASNGLSDMFSRSNEFSSKTNWFDIGLDIRSSTAADNYLASDKYFSGDQTGSKPILHPHLVTENAESDEDFGEFAAASMGNEGVQEESSEINASSSGFNGSNGSVNFFSVSNGVVDLFAPSNGKFCDSNEVSAGFDINPSAAANVEAAHRNNKFDVSLRIEQTDGESVSDPRLVVQSDESDENFGEFREAFAENALREQGELKTSDLSQFVIGTPAHDGNNQGKEIRSDHQKGALPLSIFGDEEPETAISLNTDDTFMLQPASSKGNGHSPNSTISISDLISNLYSQTEQISFANSPQKQVINGLDQSDSFSVSNLVNVADGDDNSSWEFKDSLSHGGAESVTSFCEKENALERSSGKLKLQSYVNFYSKLKDELFFIAKGHLASRKETQSTAVSGEDENLATLIAEIQEACKELGQGNSFNKEDSLGRHARRENNLNHFLEVLEDPNFHFLQTEYDLKRRFSLAERDFGSAIELIEHAKMMLKMLMLGSFEEQLNYISIWSKMISTCAQELQHGALIWRQSLQQNICSQILAEPQGKIFVLALGEIYRATVLLGATVKLYKPWILSSDTESSRLYSVLDECHTSWSSSGLEEALTSILDPTPPEDSLNLPSLMDSIKSIYDLDAFALQNHVFIQQEPICQLSLLTPRVAPGMAMVAWDGEHCFLRLANLWANLVSSDRPQLPPLHVNG